MPCPVQHNWRLVTMPVYDGDAKSLSLVQMKSARFLQRVYFPFLTINNLQGDTVRLRTYCFPTNLNPTASACTNDSGLNQSLLRRWQMAMFLIPSFLPHLLFGRERPLPLPALPSCSGSSFPPLSVGWV